MSAAISSKMAAASSGGEVEGGHPSGVLEGGGESSGAADWLPILYRKGLPAPPLPILRTCRSSRRLNICVKKETAGQGAHQRGSNQTAKCFPGTRVVAYCVSYVAFGEGSSRLLNQ